jgi:hypothetical protein
MQGRLVRSDGGGHMSKLISNKPNWEFLVVVIACGCAAGALIGWAIAGFIK